MSFAPLPTGFDLAREILAPAAVPARYTPGHLALVASFEAEGWSHKDALYQAAAWRRAFRVGTSDAALLAKREALLAYRAECKDGFYPASLAPVAADRVVA